MKNYNREMEGRKFEGWAFTFCKAAFLVLLTGRYALFALSGLAALFYVLATLRGVKTWHCWAKPPYVTIFWSLVCVVEAWRLWGQAWLPFPKLPFVTGP